MRASELRIRSFLEQKRDSRDSTKENDLKRRYKIRSIKNIFLYIFFLHKLQSINYLQLLRLWLCPFYRFIIMTFFFIYCCCYCYYYISLHCGFVFNLIPCSPLAPRFFFSSSQSRFRSISLVFFCALIISHTQSTFHNTQSPIEILVRDAFFIVYWATYTQFYQRTHFHFRWTY